MTLIQQATLHETLGHSIQRELKLLTENPPTNCSAGPKGDNLYEWVATVVGPVGTPYESGKFISTRKQYLDKKASR